MCRFLLAKSEQKQDFRELIAKFSTMCEASRTTEGDRQEDGAGIAWLDDNYTWQYQTWLEPFWERKELNFPSARIVVAHARSASFPNQKGILEYNQPYVNEKYAYVFNGVLKGVKLNMPIPGDIGAQKIWWLLQRSLENEKVETALKSLDNLLTENSYIRGLNIGLAGKNTISALCRYNEDAGYFTLNAFESEKLCFISSEPLPGYPGRSLTDKEIVTY